MQAVPLPLDSEQHFFISHTIGPNDLLNPSPAPHLKRFQIFLMYFRNVPVSAPYIAMLHISSLDLTPVSWGKSLLLLLLLPASSSSPPSPPPSAVAILG